MKGLIFENYLEKGHEILRTKKNFFKKLKIIKLYGDCLDRFKKAEICKKNNRYHGKNFIPPSDLVTYVI